ncbi:MAG: hypothetical protein WAW88_10380 [Nocardioides sp.]
MIGVRPLGVFGPRSRSEFALDREELLAQGTLAESLRGQVAAYLRSGALVLALMEHTRDVIDGAFGTPGGSGILTDGTFYWRADAADYVEHYGIAVDEEALDWMESNDWQAPAVTPDELSRIDAELFKRLRL